ncbi:hypothetical protein JKY72_06325 [Candidatus Gracilibacteria bacterium]|nr:hypothetical protein [Candidatus Gracilibacteria bacterium]
MSLIELERRHSKFKKRTTLESETQKAITSLITTLGIMILVLSITFLFTTNDNAQRGYTLQQKQLENEELKSISGTLHTKITQIKATSEVENSPNFQEMQNIEEKTFVTREDNEVQ